MNRKILLPVVLALVLAVLAGGAVMAQTATPPAGEDQAPGAAAPAAPRLGKGLEFGGFGGFGMGKNDWTQFDATAKALNLTPTQFFEQLHSGKTVAEIAQAQGVDLAALQKAEQDARMQAMKDAINQAVKSGKITQDQADWLLKGLENGYGGGRGFGGFGHGMRGGMREFGGGGQLKQQPTATPNA